MAMIKFVIVLLIGLALFVGFKVVRLVLARSESRRLRNAVLYLVPLEILIWTVYFFRSLEYLFGTRSYYDYLLTALVLIGLGLLIWLYLKEVVAGAFFRLQHNPKTGRFLQTSDQIGRASCRERVESAGCGGSVKRQREQNNTSKTATT